MNLTILGGGVGGLAVARGAAARGIPFALFEREAQCGGNARTFEWGDFRYDSGAHRLHSRSPRANQVFRQVLGDELHRVDALSRISSDQWNIDFPLSALGLVRQLPSAVLVRACRDMALAKVVPGNRGDDLESLALRRYGRTLARACLLNYSEKLWGLPCSQLSQVVAGGRLQGLTLGSLLSSWLRRGRSAPEHLEGEFLYPVQGIGRLAQVMESACPARSLHRNTPVERVLHDGGRIRAVVVQGEEVPVDQVVSALPMTVLLRLFEPSLSPEFVEAARSIQFRHVFLIALFLDRERVSSYATTYFPDPDLPFTRVHEPKCRSEAMAPPGKTSVVAEVPWSSDGPNLDRSAVAARVESSLIEQGWFEASQVLGSARHELHNAYPVLSLDAIQALRRINTRLLGFENLAMVGRGASFEYLHLHDLVERAEELLDRWVPALDPRIAVAI